MSDPTGEPSHPHPHRHARQVANRLARIAGHVKAIQAMVEEGRPCPEVLIQMAAVRSALNNAGKLLMEDHLEGCIVTAVRKGEAERAMAELRDALARFIG